MSNRPPVILLVYANDRVNPANHLRSLADEIGLIRDALQPAEQAGLCQVLIEANASAERVFAVFQDARYRNRIAVFHYAGHADGYRLLLESAAGGASSDQGAAQAAGLAAFLGEQGGLELVFLNGCSTAPQVEGLLQARCPAVIATSQAIDDRVAMDFAVQFYRGLGGGAGLESAFKTAVGASRTSRGDSPRAFYWGSATDPAGPADRWPWELCIKPGAEQAGAWNLPDACGAPLFGLPALPRLDLPDSPFRHLDWFAREQAEVFFGRAFQVRTLYDRITAPDAAPLLLVYGESGVGKSSVLAAGLLPRLESSHRVHYLRRDAQLGLLGTLMQPLDPASSAPGAAWHQAETNANAPLLVVLDQVEEVFTRPLADQPAELATFLDGLSDLFGRPEARPRGRLILSFRKEWLPEIDERLAERRLPRGHLFLEGLNRRGVIAAVSGATATARLRTAYRLEIADGLAAEIADDLLADPQSPIAPTLQILLTKLWSEAKRLNDDQPRFTRDLYLGLKREGILLKDFLDQQLAALEQWRPAVVHSGLALDLLAFHTTPQGTAAERREQDLLDTYAHIKEGLPELVQRSKDAYLLADITSTQREPIRGSRLAHDTLALLVRKRSEESDQPGQRARRILENRAVEWRDGAQGALLDDADLRVVEDGVTGMRDWKRDGEDRLVRASRQAREQRQREQRRLMRWKRIGSLAVLLATGVALWQWSEADRQKYTAQRQERIAIARLQESKAMGVRNEYPILALLLAAEAVKRPFDADGIRLGGPETILRELIGSMGGTPLGYGVEPAFDPQGRWLAAGGVGGTLNLFDLRDPTAAPAVLRGLGGAVYTLAFDPGGRWLAASGVENGDLHLFDLTNPNAGPVLLPGHVQALAFDPHGRWLANAVAEDPDVRLWDLADLRRGPVAVALPGGKGRLVALTFDPRGRWLAIGREYGVLGLFDPGNPSAAPIVLKGNRNKLTALRFDPDGRWLAAAGGDDGDRYLTSDGHGLAAAGSDAGYVHLFDLADPNAEPTVLRGHQGAVKTLAFDPRGQRLATGGADRTARVWNPAAPQTEPVVLRGHEDEVEALAFDPQGQRLATGSRDGTARLWNLADPRTEPEVLHGHDAGVSAVAFDPEGRWLTTAGDDLTARLWDLADLHPEPAVLRGHEGLVTTLALDAQGRRLATAGAEGTVRVRDLRDPRREPVVLRTGEVHGAFKIAFDPQGQRLATADSQRIVRIFDLADARLEPVVLPGHEDRLLRLAFDPQLRRLATSGVHETALWDLTDPERELTVLDRHQAGPTNLAFDAQGRRLATADPEKGIIRLFDLADSHPEPRVLGGRWRGIETLAFDPQGRWLATGAGDGSIRLFDITDSSTEPAMLRIVGDAVVSIAFAPQGRLLATGDAGGTVQIWDLADPGAEPVVLRGHRGWVVTLAFDHEGHWLATSDAQPGSWAGAARLWQFDVKGLIALVCRTVGRNLTLGEWRQNVGKTPYQVTCPQFPSGEALAAKAATVNQ